jgi:hypothetical protein
MPHALRHPSLAPLLAALACTPAESSRTEPDPQPSPAVADTPAAPSAAAPSEPTQASKPATPSPEPAPSPTPTPASSAELSPLRVVAVREGIIELSGWGTRLVPLIDGEPLAIAGGRPSRSGAGSRGMAPTGYLSPATSMVDFGGDLDQPGGAWLAISSQEERSTPVNLVYHQQGPTWELVDLRRGLLRAYHSFYVQRGAALLAYQRWAVDHEQAVYDEWDETPKAARFHARVEAALAKIDPGFVPLAGSPAELPVVPDGVEPYAAATDPDGTLYVLASPDHYDSPKVLLVWPPGATEAERVAMPELTSVGDVELSVAGEWVLAFGHDEGKAYLAMGKGSEWQRVSVEEADRASKSHQLAGAARAPDGTLWIAFGNRWAETGEEHPVWRKPADAWQPVPLPAFDRAWFPTDQPWGLVSSESIEEGTLVRMPPHPTFEEAATPTATDLRWGDGAVWVSLEVGQAYDEGSAGILPQGILLTTGDAAGSEPPTVLPSTPALRFERHNHVHRSDVPGARTCPHPALVLGPASLADEKPDAVRALKDHAPADASKPGIEHAYVGELDGDRVLVGLARARTPAQAKALVTALGKATGLQVTAGCRVPTVERMLE